MGQCVSGRKSKASSIQLKLKDCDKLTENNNNNFKILKFECILSNMKIKSATLKQISLKFTINGLLNCVLPKKKNLDGTQIKWITNQKFILSCNQIELRQKYLKVQACDQNYNILAYLNINLYLIVNGPYHHDFGLKIGQHDDARLKFDLKISQIVNVKLQPLKVNIQFRKQYPGQQFNFLLKLLNNKNLQIDSMPSQTITVPLLKGNSYRKMIPEQQCPSPTKIRKTASKLIKVQTTSKISWQKQKNQLPQFEFSLLSSQIMKSSLQFILWKNVSNNQQQDQCIVFGDYYIPLNKLYQIDPILIDIDQNQQRTIHLQQIIWNNGKQIGNCIFDFKIKNHRFFTQSKVCVITQDGKINMTPMFDTYISNKQSKNSTIESLIKLQNKIFAKNIQMNTLDPFLNPKQTKQIKQQIYQCFKDLLKILENSLKQSYTLTCQSQQDNLIQNQQKLLQIAYKLYNFIYDGDLQFAQICWKIQLNIIKRGQFFLKNIGFSKNQKQLINNKKIGQLLKKKILVAINFQEIIYKILIQSLKFYYGDYRKQSKQIAQIFKAYSYICVPIFRQKFLKNIQKSQDSQLIQWRISENDKIQNIQEAQEILVYQINWEEYFYSVLKDQPKSQILDKKLKDSLQSQTWFDIVGQRKNEYFYFLRFLNEKFEELGKKSKFSKWQYLPGYNKVVRSFLTEMKKIEIATYTKSLQIASVYMLVNEKLINVLMSILMQKTNCHDSATVMRTLQLFSSYFKYLTTNKPTLPLTFNYIYFLKALKRLFEKGFSYAVTKALVLIYNYYHNFSVEFRKNLAKYLLGKAFFKLFLNWSFSVRSVFFHLMILKFDDQINSIHQNMLKMSEVSIRYRQVLSVICQKQKQIQEQKRSKLITIYQKDLYKIMKRKLFTKKKKKNQPLQYHQQTPPKKRQRRGTISYSLETQLIRQRSNVQSIQQLPQQPQMKRIQLSFNQNKKFLTPQSKPRKQQSTASGQSFQLPQLVQNPQSSIKNNKTKKFSFFGEQDFALGDIEMQDKAYVTPAWAQFKEIQRLVKKHIAQKGELPIIDLGLQVSIDQKDMRPSSVDSWQ